MPPDQATEALYNILGRYEYWVERHGSMKARAIFFTSICGLRSKLLGRLAGAADHAASTLETLVKPRVP
jgi:hypothetical protein